MSYKRGCEVKGAKVGAKYGESDLLTINKGDNNSEQKKKTVDRDMSCSLESSQVTFVMTSSSLSSSSLSWCLAAAGMPEEKKKRRRRGRRKKRRKGGGKR